VYIRKDIHKSLQLEAKVAEVSKCFAWAKLFKECACLLRQKDRTIETLRAANAELIEKLSDLIDEAEDVFVCMADATGINRHKLPPQFIAAHATLAALAKQETSLQKMQRTTQEDGDE
jgi:hypothetical protein